MCVCTVDSGISDYITEFPMKVNPVFNLTRYWINLVNSELHFVCVFVCGGGGGSIGCTILSGMSGVLWDQTKQEYLLSPPS